MIRTSDAVAIALRFDCPIFCQEFILRENAITHHDEKMMSLDDMDVSELEDEPVELSLEELQSALNEALENEDYERASQLRDEIARRKPE